VSEQVCDAGIDGLEGVFIERLGGGLGESSGCEEEREKGGDASHGGLRWVASERRERW
jgi:hypothetical protein